MRAQREKEESRAERRRKRRPKQRRAMRRSTISTHALTDNTRTQYTHTQRRVHTQKHTRANRSERNEREKTRRPRDRGASGEGECRIHHKFDGLCDGDLRHAPLCNSRGCTQQRSQAGKGKEKPKGGTRGLQILVQQLGLPLLKSQASKCFTAPLTQRTHAHTDSRLGSEPSYAPPSPPCHTLKSFVYAAPSPARYLGVCTSRATSARSCFGGTRQLAGSCERKKGGKVERLGRQETAACSTAPSLTLAIRCHVSPWRGSAVR